MGRSFEEVSRDVSLADSRRDVEHLHRLIDELSEFHTPISESTIQYAYGAMLQITGDASGAIEHHRSGIAICEEHGLERQRSRHLMSIGLAQIILGELDEALLAFRTALDQADSQHDDASRSSALMSMGIVYGWKGDYDSALSLFRQSYELDEQRGDELAMAKGLNNMAVTYWNTGDIPKALAHFLRSLDIDERHNSRYGTAFCLLNIGTLYAGTGNDDAALEYLHKAVAVCTEAQDASGMAMAFYNIGNVYLHKGEHERALSYARDAHERFSALHDQQGIARSTAALCTILLAMKEYDQARANFVELDKMKIDDPRYASERERVRADLLAHDGDLSAAIEAAKKALAIASDHSLRTEEVTAHKQLRDLARKNNDLDAYVDHNERYNALREEVLGREATHRMAIQESERTIAAERAERARERSVLHSTLPKEVADRVARGEVVNDHFDNAAVLFVDVVGFTAQSSELDVTVVVNLLQNIFSSFDVLCATHDVTKIKTIGDSYMAVAFGTAKAEQRTANTEQRTANTEQRTANVMPSEVEAQRTANTEQRTVNIMSSEVEAQRIANVALAMMASEFVWPHTGERVMFRIGIHCGPVVAGVLGTERMQYDVWGDTVNVASRMESTSEPGKIHVSEALANALNDLKNSPPSPLSHASLERGSYTVVPRGIVEVKGKGTMQTYWLSEAL